VGIRKPEAAQRGLFDRSPDFEHLLTSISHNFLRLEAVNLEVGIEGALRSICEATGAELGFLLEVSQDGSKITTVHTFVDDGVDWSSSGLKGLPLDELSWLFDQLHRGKLVHISRVEDLPEVAHAVRECLRARNLKSVVCLPILADGQLQGVTCIGATVDSQEWGPKHFGFYHGAAEILGSAISRLRTELELVANREWLELAQRAGNSAAWEWHPGDDSLIFSNSTAPVFGIDRERLPKTGAELLKFIPAEDHARIARAFREVFKTGEPYMVEHRFLVPDRGTVWTMVRGQVELDENGRVARVFGVSVDITELKRAEGALQREKERAQVTLASINDGVVRTDAGGRIDFLNPSAEELLGVSLADVRGKLLSRTYRVLDMGSDKPRPNVVETCLAGQHVVEPADASLLVRGDGTTVVVRESAAPIFAVNGALEGAVLVITDVSQVHSLQRRMTHLATHDPLTGLINRREFEVRLQEAITTASSSHRQFALCYLDLDEFKVVNDTCGHGAGDELLKQLTSVLDKVIPEGDTLARLGGDEFGILLADHDPDEATEHARAVIDAVRQYRFQWEDRVFEIAASIGIVPVVGGHGNLAELLSAADSACYVAKGRGRNEIHISRKDDSAITFRHTEMEWVERLNRALEENRFRLFKQPIRPLQNRDEPEYNELLLRLIDVEGSIIVPSQFITAAERYRMMPVIDLWVVGAALNAIGSLDDSGSEGPAAFTINLSGQSFGNKELKQLILDGLDRLQIPPHRVMFEITETAAISNLSLALDFIHSLRDRGCRFILDDFGSGLSSFRYLKSLDVEFLKIDGALVREIVDDPIQREMVAAIHRIGESMGIQTIGEWVENSEIERTLTDIGVDYAQGYGVGRPVPFMD
jgi:diguanylate cyclase (GGDEF)-like protein/PAS domain S-box-containing protein